MRRSSLLFALFLIACEAQSTDLVAAVGVGDGPHKGFLQETRGTRVEVVPMNDGTLRAYVSDESGAPLRAQGEVKATISAPSFAPAEVILTPSADGAYFVGALPGPPPQTPAEVVLTFPQGVVLTYSQIPLAAGVVIEPVAPVEAAVVVEGVPPGFVPPHKGTVSRVGDNLVEVVIAPKGEVQTYVYDLSGAPVPIAEVKIPSVQIVYQEKPYTVKLKPAPKGAYLVGRIDAKVTIPAQAEVEIAFVEPVIIHEVTYEPDVIVFPTYVVYEPIVIVPAAVVVEPAVPVIEVVPPRIEVGIGIGVGVDVHKHKHHHHGKGKGHYKHKHKHSHSH